MMPNIKITTLCLAIFANTFFSNGGNSLNAQGNSLTTSQLLGQLNTITTSVPFLLISPDSRAGGMGDLGVASSPDANSIHWNPSKLAFLDKKMGLGISYTPWLRALVPDINLAYLSYYHRFKKGTFATSLRYFSLGDITFTDVVGNVTGQFRPNEFALDAAYGIKLGEFFSGGGAARFIYSNLTGNANAGGSSTRPGTSFSVDVSGFYQNKQVELSGKKSVVTGGFNISNLGAKIAYTSSGIKNFIPINLRLGGGLEMKLDNYNSITFLMDINKLLVPTPPLYAKDSNGNFIPDPAGGYVIESGKDPNRGVVSGMLGSFNDAPAGFKEELREYILAGGVEYWYSNDKGKLFAVRAGYFNEAATKGNRKYFTVGFGIKYTVFGFDFAYLIPTTQRNPLQNTLRFSLLFDLDSSKKTSETPSN
jgi:hypothetical protein